MKIWSNLLLAFLLPFLSACPSGPAPRGDRPIEVSQDLYDRTFSEILSFLREMDGIIARRDFGAWQERCTAEFIAHYSDPARLREISLKPSLRDRKIVLNSLLDYFLNVFIPSRVEKRPDRIEFIERRRVKTIALVGDTPYVVYYLEQDENNQWKLAVW